MNRWIYSIFFCWLPWTGLAQTNSVDEVVAEALAHHHELRVYEAEVEAAKGQRRHAGLWQNPEVSGEYGEKRAKAKDGAFEGEGSAKRLEITQTFEFPGKGSLRKAIAEKNVEIAELGLSQFRLALAGQIRNLAHEYLVASENASAAQEISERSADLIESLQKRQTPGVQLLLEKRAIEGSLIELQQLAKEFIQQRDEARIELNTLLHRPLDQPLAVQTGVSLPPHLKQSLTEIVSTAVTNNLQLKIRSTELERSDKEVSAARLETAPDFKIGPFYSEEKASEREQIVGILLSMPLPLWNWNQGNIQTSKARQSQAHAELLHARHKVESETAKRFRSYQLTLQQLEKSPADTVRYLQEAADIAERQYRLGAIDIQLYLEVQRQFLSAQQVRGKALLEAWRDYLDLQLLMAAESALYPKTGTGGEK